MSGWREARERLDADKYGTNGIPLLVIQWAAESCAKQPECGPMDVPNMVRAWDYAWRYQDSPITWERFCTVIRKVCPGIQQLSVLRRVPAVIHGIHAVNPDNLPRAMHQLLDNQPDVYNREFLNTDKYAADVTSWYKQFEEIHPCVNGNGRAGDIFYNWHLGTLKCPVLAPDLWA